MNKQIPYILSASLSLAVAGLTSAGCSSDDSSKPSSGQQSAPVSKSVAAATGATVEDSSGAMKLAIPPGALASDTTITVAVEAQNADTVAPVYNFGPDGTKFEKPVPIQIKYDGPAPPEGKKLALATYDGTTGKWVVLDGAAYADGVVMGKVEHFSKISIVLLDGKFVLVSECEHVVETFTPCGGASIEGTWVFENFCFSAQQLGSGNGGDADFFAKCAGITASFEIQGDVTATATTVGVGQLTTTSSTNLDLSLTCLKEAVAQQAAAKNQPVPAGSLDSLTCTTFFKADGSGPFSNCTQEGDVCKCSGSETKTQPAQEPKPYTLSDNKVVTSDGGKEYCVQGDRLLVNTGNDTSKQIMVLRKK